MISQVAARGLPKGRHHRYLIASLAVVLLCGCVGSGHNNVPTLDVDIKQLTAERYAVVIKLPKQTKRFMFSRAPSIPIRANWQLANASQRLERAGTRDLVVADKPFREISLIVEADDQFITGDYSLTRTFANNQGAILYLGHFAGAPEVPCTRNRNKQPPCLADWDTRYNISPTSGELVWLDRETHRLPFSWLDQSRNGAFAYFGQLPAQRFGEWQAIIDPNLPQWMADDLQTYAPKITQLYGQWLKQPLTLKPQLLFNMQAGKGLSASGGVIGNMAQFTVAGDAWQTKDATNRARFLKLVAHEVAHFWNSGIINHDHSAGANWLHEGGAEALAQQALAQLGVVDDSQLWQARTQSVNECLSLRDSPVNDAANQGRFDLYYACGETIELAVAGMLRQQGLPTQAHWQKLFEQAKVSSAAKPNSKSIATTTNGQYSASIYFATLRELLPNSAWVNSLQTFTEQGLPPGQLIDLLETAGIATQPVPKRAGGYPKRALMRHLQMDDCGGRFSVTQQQDTISLEPLANCQTVLAKPVKVTAVSQFELAKHFDLAHESVVQACKRGRSVLVSGEVEGNIYEMEIICETPFRYLNLKGWRNSR